MDKFEDRKKAFEKKFISDQEKQFKINALKNKFLAEWIADRMGKNETEKKIYIEEVIKSDFEEPGDEDVFRKIKKDLTTFGKNVEDSEIRNQMDNALVRAKKEFS